MGKTNIVWAEEEKEPSAEEYYSQQVEESGAEDLPGYLDEETRRQLAALGVEDVNPENFMNLSPETIFESLGNAAEQASRQPFQVLTMLLSVILLSALLSGLKTGLGTSVATTASLVGVLCVCLILVQPVLSFFHQAETVVKAGAGFMLACIPVLAGILLAAGQPMASSSFQILMTAAGNAVSFLCAGILIPLMNSYLGISVVSAVSPETKLNGVCNAFSKTVKWILGLCMTVFTGLLTIQSIVTTAADSAGGRAARFVVSSFVPIVGGALGEALGTVAGCVKTLKSGVTAFLILAEGVLFLPVLLQCILWRITIAFCAGVSQMFGLSAITDLLESVGKVTETLQAILLCSMAVMTVTSTILLMLGGGGT